MPKSASELPVGKPLRSGDYGCQYAAHDSPVHRMGAGWKLAFGMLLSALAAGVRTPVTLLALVVVTLAYYLAARLTPGDLWRDRREVSRHDSSTGIVTRRQPVPARQRWSWINWGC